MIQALVVVILDIPAEGCIILCGMAVNSSMSVTHRLIPQALSVLSHSQACMYTLCPTLLIPPTSLSLLAAPPIYLSCSPCALPFLPSLLSLFSAFHAIKGSGEYYHLGTILSLARLMQPDDTHANTLKCTYCIYTYRVSGLISTRWRQTLN